MLLNGCFLLFQIGPKHAEASAVVRDAVAFAIKEQADIVRFDSKSLSCERSLFTVMWCTTCLGEFVTYFTTNNEM